MENTIEVMADGTADQGGTNVDIRILDNGQTVKNEKGKEVGGISLKTSATKQLRQTNMTWGGLSLLLEETLGVKVDDAAHQQIYVDAVSDYRKKSKAQGGVSKADKKIVSDIVYEIYNDAYTQLRTILSGDASEGEKELLEKIKLGIQIAAMMEGQDIVFVSLGNREYKELDFGESVSKITEVANFFPYIERKSGETEYPYLYILDAGTKESPRPTKPAGRGPDQNIILAVRPKMESDRIKHYVEKGSRLEELISKY